MKNIKNHFKLVKKKTANQNWYINKKTYRENCSN